MKKYMAIKVFAAFLLLLTFCQNAMALQLLIPPKPKHVIADEAQIFSQADIANIHTAFLKEYHIDRIPIYLLTVQQEYGAYMDTFGPRVANSWGICGEDSAVLLIMTAGPKPMVYVKAGSLNPVVNNNTMADFLSAVVFPKYIKTDGTAKAFVDFAEDVDGERLTPNLIKTRYGYNDFDREYTAGLPFAQLVAKGAPNHFWYWVIAIVLMLLAVYVFIFIPLGLTDKIKRAFSKSKSTSPQYYQPNNTANNTYTAPAVNNNTHYNNPQITHQQQQHTNPAMQTHQTTQVVHTNTGYTGTGYHHSGYSTAATVAGVAGGLLAADMLLNSMNSNDPNYDPTMDPNNPAYNPANDPNYNNNNNTNYNDTTNNSNTDDYSSTNSSSGDDYSSTSSTSSSNDYSSSDDYSSSSDSSSSSSSDDYSSSSDSSSDSGSSDDY